MKKTFLVVAAMSIATTLAFTTLLFDRTVTADCQATTDPRGGISYCEAYGASREVYGWPKLLKRPMNTEKGDPEIIQSLASSNRRAMTTNLIIFNFTTLGLLASAWGMQKKRK